MDNIRDTIALVRSTADIAGGCYECDRIYMGAGPVIVRQD
jgi:hypothetical protein